MVPHVLAALHRLRRAYDVLVVRGTRVLGLPGVLAARAAGKRVILQPEVNGEMSGEVYTWGQPFAGTPLDRVIRAGTAPPTPFCAAPTPSLPCPRPSPRRCWPPGCP